MLKPGWDNCPSFRRFRFSDYAGHGLRSVTGAARGLTMTRGGTLRKIPPGVGPKHPQVVVLVGATGDLSRRKLLPGLFYLSRAGFIPACRITGVAWDDLDADGFRTRARNSVGQHATRTVHEVDWVAFADALDYVPLAAGA